MERLARFEGRLSRIAGRVKRKFPQFDLTTWSHSLGETAWKDSWSMGIEVSGLEYPIALDLIFQQISQQPEVTLAAVDWSLPSGWTEEEGSLRTTSLTGLWKRLTFLEECLERALHRGVPPDLQYAGFVRPLRPSRPATAEDRDLEIYRAIESLQPTVFHPVTFTHRFGGTDAAKLREVFTRYGVTNFPVEAWASLVARGQEELEFGPPFRVHRAQQDWRGLRQLYALHPNAEGLSYVSRVGFAEDLAVVTLNLWKGRQPTNHFMFTIFVFERDGGSWKLRERLRPPWVRWCPKGELLDLEVGLLGSSLAQFQLLDSEYWSVVEGSGPKLLGRVQLRAELPDGTHRRFTVMTSGFASFRRAGLIATGDYVSICKHHIHHRDVVETLKGIIEHESLAQD